MKPLTDTRAYWLIALMAVLFMVPHSMAPWGNGNYPTDICVYTRCAGWIDSGLVMYRDMFDHKGPLVYAVYWAATRCGGLHGVWLLDLLIAGCFLFLSYRIARRFTDIRHALLITGLAGLYLNLPFTDEGGPGWIAMIGCTYVCYLFAKLVQDEQYCSFAEIALLSAAVAVCLLTKMNTAAGIIPVALYILVHLIRHFNWKVLLRYVAGVLTGLAVFFIPVALWLWQQGNIQDCIDAYWTFNTHGYGVAEHNSKLLSLLLITLVLLPAYMIFGCYVYCRHRDTKQVWWFAALFLVSVGLNAYMKNGYPHYIFPCFGVFVLLLAACWEQLRTHKALYITVLTLCILVGGASYGVRAYHRLSPFDTHADTEVAQFINEQCGEADYVMVCDVDDRSRWSAMSPSYSFAYRLWLLLDAKPASPYFYLPPSITPAMRAHSWQLITARMPRFVVCTEDHKQDYMALGYTLKQDIQNDFYILQRP